MPRMGGTLLSPDHCLDELMWRSSEEDADTRGSSARIPPARRGQRSGADAPARGRIRDVMSSPVVTAEPSTSLAELAERMLAARVGSVVIVDPADSARVVGIVTESDFELSGEPGPPGRRRWPRQLEPPVLSETSLERLYEERRGRPASSRMSIPVVTVQEGARVSEAVALMLENDMKHLPVLAGDRLVGIVARHDLLECLAAGVRSAPESERLQPSVFDRIVCGVEGSEESLEALRQGLRLLSETGWLIAATVWDPVWNPSEGNAGEPPAAALVEAEEAQRRARELLGDRPSTGARILEGRHCERLVALARAEQATLIAVGMCRRSRVGGILTGCVTTELLHDAPCPVLVARSPRENGRFPRAIVVGVDGSVHSAHALSVARELADRVGSSLQVLAATGGKPIREDAVAKLSALERDPRAPVEALVAASGKADLVVIGSRGLHGIRALGSVSERVAHRARCSVLVVRPMAYGGD